jgi:hypothetical protein
MSYSIAEFGTDTAVKAPVTVGLMSNRHNPSPVLEHDADTDEGIVGACR